MNLKTDLKELIDTISEKKKYLIDNEENTKNVLIIPFFNILGYDFKNPKEVTSEYGPSDFKKGEKVDYGIKSDDKIVMIVECKAVNKELVQSRSQMEYYYLHSIGKIGILTNGIHYQFFSDFDEKNKMDKRPFLDFNLERNPEQHFDDLEYFRKDKFDYYKIRDQFGLKAKIMSELRNPSEDFVKLFIKGTKTTKKINEKRPIVKKILNEILGSKTVGPKEINPPPPVGKIIVTEIPPTAQSKAKIKVAFPDGTIIEENKVVDTYVKTIEKIGPERVKEINIVRSGVNIVSKERHPNRRSIQKYIPEKQYYIHIHSSTDSKLLILNQIVSALNI